MTTEKKLYKKKKIKLEQVKVFFTLLYFFKYIILQ